MLSIRVYVVHSPALTERRPWIEAQVSRLPWPVEWVTGFEPAEIDPVIAAKVFGNNPRMTPPKQSCALKHLEAFRRIVAAKDDRALVIEDDVDLVDDFPARLEAVIDQSRPWPLRNIQLDAGQNQYVTKTERGQLLYPAADMRTTAASLISHREAAAYLAYFDSRGIKYPIDDALQFASRDLGISLLWSAPVLSTQRSQSGHFATSIARTHRPLWKVRAHYWWQKVRRRAGISA